MSSSVIYKRGQSVNLTIPAGESIAVYAKSKAQVRQVLGFPNYPNAESQLAIVSNGQTVFGPYASGATIIIENIGENVVMYQIGVAPTVAEIYSLQYQPAPNTLNATGALTAAMILNGILTSTTAAAVAGTVPTGATMDLAAEFSVDDGVVWSVINTGPNTFTVTAAAGHTIVGAAAVATATSGRFITRKTAADTFVTYRLA